MPEITIAIIALLDGDAANVCLAAARDQAAEVILVRRDGSISNADGTKIGQSTQTDVPARRRSAAQLARTPLIGFLEDTVMPAPGWALAARSALERNGVGAVGGPVAIDTALPAASRALALTEFGRYQSLAGPGSPTKALPGCNFAFRREALLEALPPEGLIDNDVFAALADAGLALDWAPQMAVKFCIPHPDGAQLVTRFNHGRLYAGRRLADVARVGRLAGALKAIALPPVLVARSLREARVADLRSPSTLGRVVMQHSAWAAGEFVGALFGPPSGGAGAWQ